MRAKLSACVVLVILAVAHPAIGAEPLAPGVRGLVTHTSVPVTMDGSLREWSEAFCTPVRYEAKNLDNRAGQFYYMWDESAFYIGLRCLDKNQANPAPLGGLYNGDAVEFYFDARPGDALRGKDWTTGAIHFFFSPFDKKELKPRWVMRGGIATSNTVLKDVEIAATQTRESYEVEFKLPWANFREFRPKLGAVLAVDAELCYGDGGPRTDRTFAYGSALSVQQPASQGKVQLVKTFDPDYIEAVGPSMFPMWVQTPDVQAERGRVQAVVAIPPAFLDYVGLVNVRLHDADGKIVKSIPALVESFGPRDLGFARGVTYWSIDDFAPGSYFATAQVESRTGKVLATVAPRMVQEAIISGR
jgi:Carbohydrate family 9 binding domain-like